MPIIPAPMMAVTRFDVHPIKFDLCSGSTTKTSSSSSHTDPRRDWRDEERMDGFDLLVCRDERDETRRGVRNGDLSRADEVGG